MNPELPHRLLRQLMSFAQVVCICGVFAACSDGRALAAREWIVNGALAGEEKCERPPRTTHLVPHVVVQDPSDRKYPCRVIATIAGNPLRYSVDGSRPDPTEPVVMTSEGRYITAAHGQAGLVLLWNSDGTLVRSYGRKGEAPGEFITYGSPGLFLFISPQDTLYVMDDGSRWTLLDKELRFVRTFTGPEAGRWRNLNHITDNGLLLTTARISSRSWKNASSSFAHLRNSQGEHVRSFGEIKLPGRKISTDYERASTYSSGNTFWAAPPVAVGGDLTLEEWTLDGQLVRTIERRVSWHPKSAYSERDHTHLPAYALHLDNQGLLWLVVVVRGPGWQPPPGEGETPKTQPTPNGAKYETHVEVIDPDAGVILASAKVDAESAWTTLLNNFFSNSTRTYKVERDSLGQATIHFLDLNIVKSRD